MKKALPIVGALAAGWLLFVIFTPRTSDEQRVIEARLKVREKLTEELNPCLWKEVQDSMRKENEVLRKRLDSLKLVD